MSPLGALAEPTGPIEPEQTNPLEPLLKKLGNDWGLSIDAKRIALNPLKGTVVIRQLIVGSSLQGSFLSIPRIAVKMDWERGQIDHADVEGANISVDMAQQIGIKQFEKSKNLGSLRQVKIHSSSVSLRSKGVDLLQLKGLTGSASDLGVVTKNGRLAAHGQLSINKGQVVFTDGNTKLTNLVLKGTFTKRQLEVSSLSGKIGGGTVTCRGVIPLEISKGGRTNPLKCHLEKVHLLRGDILDVQVSGDISLSKQAANFRVSGILDVVEGKKISPDRWGPRRFDESPLSVDITLRVKSKAGQASARLRATGSGGRVEIMGRNKRRSSRRMEDLLKTLSAPGSNDTHPD